MIPHPQSALIEPFDSFWEAPDDIVAALFTAFFRASFVLYGKKNRIFTKKIGAVARRKP